MFQQQRTVQKAGGHVSIRLKICKTKKQKKTSNLIIYLIIIIYPIYASESSRLECFKSNASNVNQNSSYLEE